MRLLKNKNDTCEWYSSKRWELLSISHESYME